MPISINLENKKALVTGAGSGIGREIALWLVRAGAQVAVLDARADKAEETVALVAAESHPSKLMASTVVGDARDDARLVDMIREATEKLGGLNIAVNNIGMMGPLGSAPWLQATPEMFRDVIDQNLVVTGISCMAEAKLMAEVDTAVGATDGTEVDTVADRVIINVSSGESTRPSPYMAGYGAAKAAINHLTTTLAVELGPLGIRVNAIAPGTTLTETVKAAFTEEHYRQVVEATPLRRETEADELARLVVFLASDLARCITGQLILADAGAHLSRTRPPNIRTDI